MHFADADGGLHHLSTHDPTQTQAVHESLDGATCRKRAFPHQLFPDVIRTVHLQIGFSDMFNVGCQFRTALGMLAQQRDVALLSYFDRYLTDRLDPIRVAVPVDEALQGLQSAG